MAPLHLGRTFNLKDLFSRKSVAAQTNVRQRRQAIQCEESIATYNSTQPLGVLTPSHLEAVSPLIAGRDAATDVVRWAQLSLVSALRGLRFSTHTLQNLTSAWPTVPGTSIVDGQGASQAPASTQNSPAAQSTQFRKQQGSGSVELQATAEQLSQYVQPVPKVGIKRARVYADLADLAYDVARVSAAFLFSRHRLLLVKTSQQSSSEHPVRNDTVEQPIDSENVNNIVPFSGDYGVARGESVTLSPETPKTPASTLAASKPRERPLEWFACDNPDNRTRIFAIQGSVSLQHWAINLSFDPVTFGDESLGVKIHRGVYETALTLYDDLLPLVTDYLTTSPKARVSFTGHSLGGSVASVLMMLFVIRGVLHPDQVSPVYTFGAPAVFCEAPSAIPAESTGKPGHTQGMSPTELLRNAARRGSLTTSSRCCRSLLRVIGVPEDAICNVIMHHDIVPRAFVCDYSAVSELLRSWGPAFRNHAGLSPVNRHKVLYDFIGTVCILQPDRRQEFVSGDEYHDMLPPFPQLYKFTLPEGMLEDACTSLRQAVLTFMNNPHPLTILSDYQSYGEQGVISRYHNPQHYAKALFGLLRKL